MTWAEVVTMLLGLYVAAGVFFAAAFLWRGVSLVDAGARGAGVGFRLLIAPGCVAMWPVLALAWRRR